MAGSKIGFLTALYLISSWIVLVSPANYQFQLQKIEKTKGDGCDMTRLKLANPNKDSLILSGPVTIQRDIPESTVVNLIGFEKKQNGQYAQNMFMTKNNLPLCTLMSKNTDTVSEMGNIPTACPIRAGTYNFGYTADTTNLPKAFPFADNIKVTMQALKSAGSDVVCEHDAYFTVVKNQVNQQPRQRG